MTDPKNNEQTTTEPHRETAAIDGGDLTEQERQLVDQGVDEPADPPADPAPAPTAAATPPGDAAPNPEPAPDPEPQPAAAQAPAPAPPAKPEPPRDFNAELDALDEQYGNGDLTAVEHARKVRELTLEEADYKADLRDWENQERQRQQSEAARAQDDWTNTCLAFERDHADFLGNPLRHQAMQQAIDLVTRQANEKGEQITNEDVLNRAYGIAKDYTNYVEPVPDPATERQKVGEALANRRPDPAPRTLGDAPTSASETIRGNESFENLDKLPITELETAFANMSPAQQEQYLATAEGAKANGRGND